jgi:hypothetical protein
MKKLRDSLIISILLTCFAVMLTYNIISFESYKKTLLMRIERHEVVKKEQEEKILARQMTARFIELKKLEKSRRTADIMEFDKIYSEIKQDYVSAVNNLLVDLDKKVVNMDQIIDLTRERIEIAERFKHDLLGIKEIPETIDSFYKELLAFADNDIYTWKQILLYYSENFSIESRQQEYDDNIRKLYNKNLELYRRLCDIQAEIYYEYGLESLQNCQS